MKKFNPFLFLPNVRFTENTKLKVCRAKKDNKIYLEEGYTATPHIEWEQRVDNGYPNVFYDSEYMEYRMYYSVFIRDDSHRETSLEDRKTSTYRETGTRESAILFARSKDGEVWERPKLGVCNYGGSTDNNIVMRKVHGAGVFRDEREPDKEKRYKMIIHNDENHHMAVSFSPDGIHWKEPCDWIGCDPFGDTHNYAWFDEVAGKYRVITRIWTDNQRIPALCESEDFIHWSEPREVYRGDGLDDQLYSMPVFIKDGIYYGLGSFFHGGDRTASDFDCVDLELLVSGDCKNWNRIERKAPFIERGRGTYGDGEADCGCIYASVPTECGEEYRIYYYGGNGQHTNFRETSLMSASIHRDELAMYTSEIGKTSRIITPMRDVPKDGLYIRAKLYEGASVRVGISEFFTIHRQPQFADGFSPEDCSLERVAENVYKVVFKGDIGALEGKKCFVFEFSEAEMFGYYE
ncbi:MAG: hypothetical protein IKU43_06620 [Clostridia bacterium]|nr:hypothetical protein [Clostridia bacterium]